MTAANNFCEPSSELHIAEDWYRRTALGDLLQLGDEEVNKDRLYRALDRLLAHKAALEAHLSERCGELFAVQNDVLLYDVTSILEELARIQSHDVVLPTPTHGQIRLRCVAQPDAAQAALLDRLGIVLSKRMRPSENVPPLLALSA